MRKKRSSQHKTCYIGILNRVINMNNDDQVTLLHLGEEAKFWNFLVEVQLKKLPTCIISSTFKNLDILYSLEYIHN